MKLKKLSLFTKIKWWLQDFFWNIKHYHLDDFKKWLKNEPGWYWNKSDSVFMTRRTKVPLDFTKYETPIVCEECGIKYRCVCGDPKYKQGVDCAAQVYQRDGEWYLCGHYGSKFDLNEYKFVYVIPYREADPVCDNCIQSWLNFGILRFVRELNP